MPINVTDSRLLIRYGRLVAKFDDKEAFKEAATLIASTASYSERMQAIMEYLEGVRNYSDGMRHYHAIEKEMQDAVEELMFGPANTPANP